MGEQPIQRRGRSVLAGVARRDTNTNSGDVPFGQLLSYGSNGSPTITVTKTLFNADTVTSTRSDGSSATGPTGSSDAKGTTVSLSSLSIAPFVGVIKTNDDGTKGTTTSTTTGTSTIFNSITVTSTSFSTSSTTTTSSSTTSSDSSSFITGSATTSASAVSSSAANETPPRARPGAVAGSVIGSFAAFSMIGFIIWYFCVKKGAKQKIQAKIGRRRKSSDVKTPQLERQSMERTRSIMLEQVKANQSREKDLDSFLAVSVAREKDDEHEPHRRAPPTAARPSWIGVAMSSSTPRNTPPLPRSNSQKSTAPSAGHPAHPIALTPGPPSQHTSKSSSLMPAPLKPAIKPEPILTSPRLDRPDNVSPLSPRGMLNAVGNTTTKAWKRASQALSPSSYQRLDGVDGFERSRPERRPSKPRNPAMEIGAQTDSKGWNGQWI